MYFHLYLIYNPVQVKYYHLSYFLYPCMPERDF